MAEPKNNRSTPTLLTRLRAPISIVLKKIGLGSSATLIHNESDKPIFLIPFSRIADDTGSRSLKMIKESLVQKIPAKKTVLVYSSWYDCSSDTYEICIIFRADSNDTDVGEFLTNLNPKVVKTEERLFFRRDLRDKRHLYLTSEEGKVIEDENAGQTSESLVTESQEGSTLENLRKEVASLKREVEVLKTEMESLQECLADIESVMKSPADEMP